MKETRTAGKYFDVQGKHQEVGKEGGGWRCEGRSNKKRP